MKLTVCIPTYNRLSELKECLDSVYSQMEGSIEVFVSDNSTNYLTEEYVMTLLGKYKNLRYKHNFENIGPDGNFLQCLQMAKGDYVWLLADDDSIKNDCIDKIINFIDKKEEVDFIELNSLWHNGDKYNKKCSLPMIEEAQFFCNKSIDKFFELININFTFVSTMIFNKKSFEQVVNPKQYFNTYFLQSHLAVACMQRLKKVAIISQAIVFGRGGNSGGYNLYKVFIKSWKDVLFKTAFKKEIISKKCAKEIYSNTIRNFVTGWLIQEKLEGLSSFDTKHKIKYFKYCFFTNGAWARLYLVWLMPKWLLRFLLKKKKNKVSL